MTLFQFKKNIVPLQMGLIPTLIPYLVSVLFQSSFAFLPSIEVSTGRYLCRESFSKLGTASPDFSHRKGNGLLSTIWNEATNGTPFPRYPIERGSTVDSRKIVLPTSTLSIRVAHILFETEEMATSALQQLTSPPHTSFREMAGQISACKVTRSKNGDVGWIHASSNEDYIQADDGGSNTFEVLPRAAQLEIFQRTTKPGDITMLKTSKGVHLIQILDKKERDVSKMITVRKPRRNWQHQSSSFDLYLAERQRYYKIETMGCQMNLADSERMEGQLHNLGMLPSDGQEPDIVVFNTCSIREHAEQKVYSYLGAYAKRKRDHVQDDLIIVVTGCVAQQEGEGLLRKVPEIDLILGPQYSNRISDLLEDVITNKNQVVATEASHIMEDYTKPKRSSKVTAWINVIYGCNERCTYCVVPTTRGVEQSRPIESIVEEVQDLVASGYKEVCLLGQNIDAYGRDMIPKRKFSDLLKIVGRIPGLDRLRFVTSHPRYMSMSVIDAVMEAQPVICQSFHVPFQSGSNKILNTMGRGHTREAFLAIVSRIRSKLPDASITTDAIVGFPGETEEDFQDTLRLMEEVRFDSVNTAAYSPRPHTPAASWGHLQLPEDVKKDRLQRINALNLKHASERRERMLGRIVEILVEDANPRMRSTQVMGRTTHGYIVYCDGNLDLLCGTLSPYFMAWYHSKKHPFLEWLNYLCKQHIFMPD